MRSVVTLKDVATAAQVSLSTASNALNRPDRVAAESRERVLAAAEQLGYQPGGARRKDSVQRRMGVIAPFSTYASYSERLKGILSVLAADHIEALIFDHPSASRSPSPRLQALPFSGNLDGLIVMGIPTTPELVDRFLAHHLPTVLVDTSHPRLTSVVLDERHGAALVAQHLIERGIRRFVYVTEGQVSAEYVSQGSQRRAGFIEALAAGGVSEDQLTVLRAASGDLEGGRSVAERIARIALEQRVGVLCGHDVLAAGVLLGLRQADIRVPEQAAVVGWDGGDVVEALGLSTVSQPLYDSGRLGAERLIAHVRDPLAPVEHIALQARLAIGATS